MSLTRIEYDDLLPSLKIAISSLKGSAKRKFAGQLSLDLGWGGKSLVSKTLSISRKTISKGITEIETGEAIKDNFTQRGRKPLEAYNPELLRSIKKIVDGSSQIDPKFTSERLYTRLSASQVRKQLLKQGYTESELPTNQTIWNKMVFFRLQTKAGSENKTEKKIKETDAIFAQLEKEHSTCCIEEGVLRISMDAKDRVKIGVFARSGRNWSKLKANDHDFGKEYITPFGFYLPELKTTHFYFTESKVTADFIVDALTAFWQTTSGRLKKIHTLVINSDNGPECQSRRTQFIKRICEFSIEHNIIVKLAYYPPYHSKYNPIERVWGGLEQFWNGDILDTKETVLNFAHNFVWAGKRAVVTLMEEVYKTGVKLSAKEMKIYEKAIIRLDDQIGKWFVTFDPERIKDVLNYG